MTAHVYYWVTLGLLLLLAFAVGLVGRRVTQACQGVNRKTGGLLLLIVLAGVLLRFLAMPNQHGVYYDEFSHLDLARVACERQAVGQPRTEQPAQEPRKYVRTKWGPGYHVLLSCWWHVTGVSESAAFCLSRVLGSLSVVLAFLLGTLAFADQKAGLWMALLMAIYPLHVKFSAGTSLEVPSVFFLLLLLCAFGLYLREPAPVSGFAVLAAAAYYALVRPENLLLAGPPVFYVGWSLWKARPDWRWRLLLAAAVMLSLAPAAYHGIHAAAKEADWINAHPTSALFDDLLFWFVSTLHPVIYTLLAALGAIVWGCGRRSKLAGLLAACFLLYVLFYALVHQSSFLHVDLARFALNFSVITVIGATAGIMWLTGRYPWAAFPVIGLLAATLALGSGRMVRPFREAMELEEKFVREAAPCLPADSLVLTPQPEYNRVLQGVSAEPWGFLFDPEARRELVGLQRPLVLYVNIPASKDGASLRRRLEECGWQRTALKSTEIDGAEVGFYLVRPADR